jgi:hypothetical protein
VENRGEQTLIVQQPISTQEPSSWVDDEFVEDGDQESKGSWVDFEYWVEDEQPNIGWDVVRSVCFEGNPLNHQLQSFTDCLGHITKLNPVPLAARLGFLTSAARCQSSLDLPGLLRWPPECTGPCYQPRNSAGDAAPYVGAAHTCRSNAYCLPREAAAACPPFMTPTSSPPSTAPPSSRPHSRCIRTVRARS